MAKFTVFIGGVTDSNNYSRGTGTTTRVTEMELDKPSINKLPTLVLTLANADPTDVNLAYYKSGVRNELFLYAGTNLSTSDEMVYRFRVETVKFKSDGYCKLEVKQWAGGAGGTMMDEQGFNRYQKEYKGTPIQILESGEGGFLITGEGTSDEVDAIDVSSATSRITSFKPGRGSKNHLQALEKYSEGGSYEFEFVES